MNKIVIGKSGGKVDMSAGSTRVAKKYTSLADVDLVNGMKCSGRVKLLNAGGGTFDFKGHYIAGDEYFLIKIADGTVYATIGGGHLVMELLALSLGGE